MNREKFEALPEIAERLKVGDVYWNEETKSYKFTGGTYRRATFINGAYYAFCEQEKRIQAIVSLVWYETPDYDLDNKIEELLK